MGHSFASKSIATLSFLQFSSGVLVPVASSVASSLVVVVLLVVVIILGIVIINNCKQHSPVSGNIINCCLATCWLCQRLWLLIFSVLGPPWTQALLGLGIFFDTLTYRRAPLLTILPKKEDFI